VLVTDQYGNKVTSAPLVSSVLDRTDVGAVFSPTSPFNIPANNVLTMTLTLAAPPTNQQRLTITGGSYTDGNSGFFTVVANRWITLRWEASAPTRPPGSRSVRSLRPGHLQQPSAYLHQPHLSDLALADYHNPEQSVINVAGGTSGAPTSVTWTVSSGFSQGIWTGNITVTAPPRRTFSCPAIPTARGIRVPALPSRRPGQHDQSFRHRAGPSLPAGRRRGTGNTTGGYSGTPDAQQSGVAFGVTVYATDEW